MKRTTPPRLRLELEQAASLLREARPTAVNLDWGLRGVMLRVDQAAEDAGEMRRAALQAALALAEADVRTNRRMAEVGAALIDDGDTVIHHCNTGALAAVDWGTALGVIRMAHEQGKRLHVLVDETRPRLQGARLTAWELEQYGIPYEIITDNAAGYFLRSGQAQKVLLRSRPRGSQRRCGQQDRHLHAGAGCPAITACRSTPSCRSRRST